MARATAAAAVDVRKQLSQRVVGLYRRMCREVHAVRTMYIIDETPAEIRHMLLLQFRKNQTVTDPRVLDMLIQKGEMELHEARQQWKQRGHLMALLKPEIEPADPYFDTNEWFRQFSNGTLNVSIFCDSPAEMREKVETLEKMSLAKGKSAKEQQRLLGKSVSPAKPWAERMGGIAPLQLQ